MSDSPQKFLYFLFILKLKLKVKWMVDLISPIYLIRGDNYLLSFYTLS